MGTLYHHLPRLERDGLVRTETHGRRRLVYPTDGPQGPSMHGLRGQTRLKVAQAVLQLGPVTREELEQATGLSRRVVYHHLKALADAGHVERERFTRTLAAAPTLRALLDEPQDDRGTNP